MTHLGYWSASTPTISAHPDLVEQLKAAAGRPMSEVERFEQQVSWVYGQLGSHSTLSKDDVRRMLRERY